MSTRIAGGFQRLGRFVETEVVAGPSADVLEDLIDASLTEVLAKLSGHDDKDVNVLREALDEPEGL